jgi:hypothetical protein
LCLFAVLALASVLGLVINVNRLRFEGRTAEDMRVLLAQPPSAVARTSGAPLPRPVARYRDLAVGERAPVRTLWVSHGGTFRLSPTGKALPIRGTQLFTADPPGFVWLGQVGMAPGIWIDAEYMAVAGRGSMRVLLDCSVTLADARGPDLDQGSALRLLAEMPWFPTSLFDSRSVTWAPIDAQHARATLRLGVTEVSGIFEFGNDGLPTSFSAQRSMGKGGLRPWSGVYRDFRKVSGMWVPFEAEVSWQLEAGPYSYAHWLVDALDYDQSSNGALHAGLSDHQRTEKEQLQ